MVSDGKKGENSPFAQEILKYLKSGKEMINIGELSDLVTKAISYNYDQQAECFPMYQSGHEGGQFVFFKREKTPKVDTIIYDKPISKDLHKPQISFDSKDSHKPKISFDSQEWQRRLRNLTTDIKQQKCVVFLGPEIVKINGIMLNQILRDQLAETNADDISHYYERDGFFLFREKMAKEDVQREVVLFYEDHHTETDVDETIFKQLVRLKTHLVLSINPDSFLSDVAYKYGIKHRFAFFQHGGEPVAEVEEPTAEIPLFYNLCGATDRDDSLVLDNTDSYRLLSSVLGSPGLPLKLKMSLQIAKHFLFLGFDFNNRVITQLLSLISGEKAIRKFALYSSELDIDTEIFLVKQFGIEFIEDEAAFLDELFNQCATQGLMRDIVETQTPNTVQVVKHIQNGDLLKALTFALEHAADDDDKNHFTQLLAQYHNLENRQSKGTIDSRDYSVQWNKIIDAVLEKINDKS